MQKQMSFSQAEYGTKKKTTRREKFLGEMEAVVPWARLVAVIEPFYPAGERGRPPIGIERMLRIYFLQQWYALADEALEDAIYDSQAMRTFAGIDLGVEGVPDATTILGFRHLLEEHELTRRIFEEVGVLLSQKKLTLREGTIVDATMIAAPCSTKNARKARDPANAFRQEGQPVAFWPEGAPRSGRALGSGALAERDGGPRGGHRPDPCAAARAGERGVCRRGLHRGGEAPGDAPGARESAL